MNEIASFLAAMLVVMGGFAAVYLLIEFTISVLG